MTWFRRGGEMVHASRGCCQAMANMIMCVVLWAPFRRFWPRFIWKEVRKENVGALTVLLLLRLPTLFIYVIPSSEDGEILLLCGSLSSFLVILSANHLVPENVPPTSTIFLEGNASTVESTLGQVARHTLLLLEFLLLDLGRWRSTTRLDINSFLESNFISTYSMSNRYLVNRSTRVSGHNWRWADRIWQQTGILARNWSWRGNKYQRYVLTTPVGLC
jgi:hypothetical protein